MLPTMLGPLAPAIAHEFQLGPAAMGPLFSATVIGQSVGLVLMPVVARSIGHRSSVVLSLACLALVQMCSGFAPGLTALFSLRVAEGFFLGGALPSAMVLVARAVPPERRATAVMSLFVGLAAGATMAGLVSRYFVDGSAWARLAHLQRRLYTHHGGDTSLASSTVESCGRARHGQRTPAPDGNAAFAQGHTASLGAVCLCLHHLLRTDLLVAVA